MRDFNAVRMRSVNPAAPQSALRYYLKDLARPLVLHSGWIRDKVGGPTPWRNVLEKGAAPGPPGSTPVQIRRWGVLQCVASSVLCVRVRFQGDHVSMVDHAVLWHIQETSEFAQKM